MYRLHQHACLFPNVGQKQPPAYPYTLPVFPKQWSHLQWVRDLLVPGCFLFIKSIQGVCTEEGGRTLSNKSTFLLRGLHNKNDVIMRSWVAESSSYHETEHGVYIHRFLLLCATVRSPYLVTSTPYHPPRGQKKSNASVSFHPKALRSKSTPSMARNRWVTAVKSSGTHLIIFRNVVSLLPPVLLVQCSAWPHVVLCPPKYNLRKIHLVPCVSC